MSDRLDHAFVPAAEPPARRDDDAPPCEPAARHDAAPATPAFPPATAPLDLTRIGALIAATPIWDDTRLGASIDATLDGWDGASDVWVFAYGSLIWKPEFAHIEARRARVHGLHRRLCLWSTLTRGTCAAPGLVLGLDAGGSCDGVAYRLPARDVRDAFTRLWQREMKRGSYLPVFLRTRTERGPISALAFAINRELPCYAGHLGDAQVAEVLRRAAHGRCGSSRDYVLHTVAALRGHGIHDAGLERVAALLG
ncbi:gamma-glutamylcyclotransferase [Derxia gummosa]|uniref:glutathione-specific gamma-glutamylcyclotransferase n=1 Tax=Derxia gummosa DSM 723 TaxID=1121388 RepID=A0A8B6XBV4_9BURK|nr:gamma-glutamylcyclotransferase [Derxia gummosa]